MALTTDSCNLFSTLLQLTYLNDNPKVEILGSWAYEFESDHLNESLYLNKTPKDKKTIENYFHYRNPLIHPTIMFRKKVLFFINVDSIS